MNIPCNCSINITDNSSLEGHYKVHLSGLFIREWIYIKYQNKVNIIINYIERGSVGPTESKPFDSHWKSIQRFGLGDKCRLWYWIQCAYPFHKFTEGGLHLQKARHSPTTLPTMIHSEAFCNNIWPPHPSPFNKNKLINRAGFPLYVTWERFILT